MTPRYPGIARACFHLNWIFLIFWGLYLAGPDASGLLPIDRAGGTYALISGGLFAVHFVLVSTGIIALFVVIIEVHAGRPVRGFVSVIAALALPVLSFLYFAARYLLQVERFLDS
jgi:threonine/homoserine efflux transporter RhtA